MKTAVDATIKIDVLNVPELVWKCRHELAKLIREGAKEESDQRVASRLRTIADRFEAGE